MKKINFSLCLLLFCYCCFSQNAYYDALKLRSYVSVNKNGAIFSRAYEPKIDSILSKYAYGADANEKIREYYRERPIPNPFLKDLIPSDWPSSDNSKINTSLLGGFSISSLGSLNVTNLADGIAQFLIERGKEELNIAFFNRMKEFLDDPDYPECRTLFPVTAEFLKNISTYKYAELIQSLREAFYKDLFNLTVGLNELIDLPKYKELLKNLPQIRAAVRCSKIVSELSQSDQGILPDSLIHELAGLPEWKEINSNLGYSLKLLDIISQSIRDSSSFNNPAPANDSLITRRRWVKLSDFNALVKDPITLQIFIGLIYQEVSRNDIVLGGKRVDDFMKENKNTISVISGLIENFALLASDVDRTIKDLRDKLAKGTLGNEDYYTYVSKAINITEYGFKVANTVSDGTINDNYIVIARNANNLYKNIYTKNYNNAIMNSYTILEQVSDIVNGSALPDNLKKIGPKSEFIANVLKYGNFMASVVKAESGEDVQKALDAAALPAGSYSIKQRSAVNVSVNGYIGYGMDFSKPFKTVYAQGVYAPLGVNINFGSITRLFDHGALKKHGITTTLFASLIDVGSLATYRLQNGNTDSLKQQIRLESIFSPSAQIFFEVRGYPFAVGGGWRRTPKLFYSDKTSSFNAVLARDIFNLSLLIDIPILTIHNKQFEKK